MTDINQVREVARAVCENPDSTGRERRDAIDPFKEAVQELIAKQGPKDRPSDGEALLRADLLRFEQLAAQKEADEERDDPQFVASTKDDLAYLQGSKPTKAATQGT